MTHHARFAATAALTLAAAAGCGGGGMTAAGTDLADAAVTGTATSRDAALDSSGPREAGSDRTPCVPTGPEICDGKDNDCDGVVDNGFTWQGSHVGSACYPGVGACITKGVVVCADPMTAACSTTPGAVDESFHPVAAPNGSWDWNCNNNVDRKYPLAPCESFGAAACPSQGWKTQPGEAGDCGQTLLQQACAVTGSTCSSSGSPVSVTEACK